MESTRAGTFKTNLSGQAAYQSFVPAPLPPNPQLELDPDARDLLFDAAGELALLDSQSMNIPDINLLVSMYIRKEALMSSQIEGTQATLEDVLDPKIARNANRNVAEVINYIKATEYAIRRQEELPLCNRLIKETHAILMDGVRGQERSPGEFRRSQNWIGGQGSTLSTARYIPPNPEDMVLAMSDLEKYMNRDGNAKAESCDGLSGSSSVLVRAALVHYQFETIHPFLDGNGRVGRLLITLYLMGQNALRAPTLYISHFLKRNRIEYYDRMGEVRSKGNYEQWVRFFAQAVLESARDANGTVGKLSELHSRNTQTILGMGRAAKMALRLFGYLEASPIIEIGKTAEVLGIAFSTVASAVNRLCEAGILEQYSGNMRNRTFCYKEYLELFRDGT